MRMCFQIVVDQKGKTGGLFVPEGNSRHLSIVFAGDVVKSLDGLFEGGAAKFTPFRMVPRGTNGHEIGAVGEGGNLKHGVTSAVVW